MVSTIVTADNVNGSGVKSHGSRWRRGFALASLGLGGLVLGGFPLWAARRILYPMTAMPLPLGMDEHLEIDVSVAPERVEFDSRDGKRLSGWFVPAPEGAEPPWPCVLLVYGYGGHKEQMAGYASMLHEGGFATLMFDMHGSGLRRGEPTSLGYRERWDVMDAVLYARTRPDVDPDRIGALGVSMGAATALMAAEEDPHIKSIVADSAYANLTDMVQPGLRTFVGAPAAYFAPLIVRFAETMSGMKSSEVRPVKSAARMGNRPLFVIHGTNDDLTDPASAGKIFAAAQGPKELWMVPDCGHGQGPVVSPEEYKHRINDFFQRTLTQDAAQ
jgi:uncharacterized protein